MVLGVKGVSTGLVHEALVQTQTPSMKSDSQTVDRR